MWARMSMCPEQVGGIVMRAEGGADRSDMWPCATAVTTSVAMIFQLTGSTEDARCGCVHVHGVRPEEADQRDVKALGKFNCQGRRRTNGRDQG